MLCYAKKTAPTFSVFWYSGRQVLCRCSSFAFSSLFMELYISLISALVLIKEAQQQHGLRHGDYQRYRYVEHWSSFGTCCCSVKLVEFNFYGMVYFPLYLTFPPIPCSGQKEERNRGKFYLIKWCWCLWWCIKLQRWCYVTDLSKWLYWMNLCYSCHFFFLKFQTLLIADTQIAVT